MTARERIVRDLGLPPGTGDDAPALEGYRLWCSDRGREPSDVVTLKELAGLVGTTGRTVRRWIESGALVTDLLMVGKVRQHRVRLSHGYAVANGRRENLERARTSPLEDVAGRLDAMTRELAQVREELHDLKAQNAAMREELIRALPAPRRPWWRVWDAGRRD